jgi:hypothetical protein
MKSKNRQPEPTTSALPVFLMWRKLPDDPRRPWKRQWFGHELAPKNPFTVRGIGIREPQFRRNVHRPHGTGDWLVMLFHKPPRLERVNSLASHPALTLVIWPPGAEQFYGWSQRANAEPHSWMHIEGTFVSQQIESLKLPVNTPFSLPNENVMVNALEDLYEEMLQGLHADTVILQNLFENWARGIHRQIQSMIGIRFCPVSAARARGIVAGRAKSRGRTPPARPSCWSPATRRRRGRASCPAGTCRRGAVAATAARSHR